MYIYDKYICKDVTFFSFSLISANCIGRRTFVLSDDDDVYLDELQTRGVKKSIL
jgi:hypothetical protein